MSEVGNNDPAREPMPGSPTQLGSGPCFYGAAVRQSRESIGERKLFHEPRFRSKLPMEFDGPDTDSHSRPQFAPMERLRQVILGSRMQCFDKTSFRETGESSTTSTLKSFPIGFIYPSVLDLNSPGLSSWRPLPLVIRCGTQ